MIGIRNRPPKRDVLNFKKYFQIFKKRVSYINIYEWQFNYRSIEHSLLNVVY